VRHQRQVTSLLTLFRQSLRTKKKQNWQWDGLSEVMHRPRKREPAYLHLTAGDRSSVSYLMPMVAGRDGYEPILEVHLDTITVTSSLNDIRLVSAESCRVRALCLSLLSSIEFPVRSIANCRRHFLGMLNARGPSRSRYGNQFYFSFATISICSLTWAKIIITDSSP
jgi:hypothetical protein